MKKSPKLWEPQTEVLTTEELPKGFQAARSVEGELHNTAVFVSVFK